MTVSQSAALDIASADFDPIEAAIAQGPSTVVTTMFSSTMLGILGRRGSTKSGLAAYLAAEKVRAATKKLKPGEKPTLVVLHNGFLRFGTQISARQLISAMENDQLWDEMVGGDHITEVLLCIDEIQEWFDPLRTQSLLQYKLSHLLQQTRKRSVSIIWTTQKPSMISRRLTDQTDYAIYVNAHQRPWRPKRAKKPRFFNEKRFAPRCKARRSHPNCTKFPKQHTVNIKIVAQDNSPVEAGLTVYGKLHCVQRFYGLWDSEKVISATETLEMNAATMKAERQFEEMVAAGIVINELVAEGKDRIVSAEFATELAVRAGIVKEATQAGKTLGAWGQQQKRTNTARFYVLSKVDIPTEVADDTES